MTQKDTGCTWFSLLPRFKVDDPLLHHERKKSEPKNEQFVRILTFSKRKYEFHQMIFVNMM